MGFVGARRLGPAKPKRQAGQGGQARIGGVGGERRGLVDFAGLAGPRAGGGRPRAHADRPPAGTHLRRAGRDLGRHAVPRVGFAPRRIPQMVRNDFQKQRLSDRPGHGHSCRGQRSGLEIGKVGSEGAQRVLAHAPAGQVLQDLDVAVGEELGQTLESRFGRAVMPTLEG